MSAVALLGATAVEHRVCEECTGPVNDQGQGEDRGWVHTDTGLYRCGWGGGFATPVPGEEAMERAIEKAAIEAEEVGREHGFEDGKTEGLAEGEEVGARAMFDTVALAFTDAMMAVPDDADADTLRAALQSAWTSIGARP
ncbi:hypothetical protein SEA_SERENDIPITOUS_57 [Mycobacterium phage Serendipitous]|uniref:Uncharacterized protein n=1 Tax=Mycobacterium phage Serendipitous TaxID=2301619 RepID=A0A385UGF1_9CAUD|nr:hypothetical protein I5G64_gp57 [Mycobacterium phage Serendipitous]AYB70598.1 hypothetical protein SEA_SERENDIPITOUS_57 [Mycobacterium phage Serendipitous]